MHHWGKRILLLMWLIVLGGCDQISQPRVELSVIAGSELKDIEPMLDEIASQTGVRLKMHYIGTLDGAEKVVLNQEHYDLAWFSHAKYLSLLQGQNKRIHAQEKIGLSPVIPAVRETLARQWGWLDGANVTWGDIAKKAASGEFRYAMTDPTASNSGFSTVMGVQAAFSGSSDVITALDVDTEQLKAFFSGQKLTSGSSGWLAESYVKDQATLDGLFNYESVLMQLNQSGQLREKLVLLYPKEGMVTADYPLILLDNTKKEAYQGLVEYLTASPFQQWMMQHTNRRPVIPEVALSAKFPAGYLMELPFPNSISTVNEILFAYLDEHRRPSHSFFVLDVSGSMTGQRIQLLKQAMNNLTGNDNSISGQFARFRKREKVTIIAFNTRVKSAVNFSIDNTVSSSDSMLQIRHYIDQLKAGGGTAIYDALGYAYKMAGEARAHHPDRFYSIVLMSDGDNVSGGNLNDFEMFYRQNADDVTGIRTFPILFGDANESAMKSLAQTTGGRVFDSRKHSLASVFKKIRGYQ